METRLDQLARQLAGCRRRGNKLSLEHVLESAKILAEAQAIAKRAFGRWLHAQGHMAYETARRHLRVAEFVRQNHSLTSEIATLSLSKVYALSSLDSALGRRYLTGERKFSAPLNEMSDVRFRQEFVERHPMEKKRTTREHVYRAAFSALIKAKKLVARAGRYASRLTPLQKRRLMEGIQALTLAATAGRIAV